MPSHSDYGFFTVPEPRLVHIWIFTPGGRLPTHCIILHNSSRYILPSSKWWHKGYLVHGSPNRTQIIGGVSLARRAILLSLSLLSLAHSLSLKIFTCSTSISYFQKVCLTSFIVLACLNWFSSFQLCEKLTTEFDDLPWTKNKEKFPTVALFDACRGREARRIILALFPLWEMQSPAQGRRGWTRLGTPFHGD